MIDNIIIWDRRKPREKNLSYKVWMSLQSAFPNVKLVNEVMPKKKYQMLDKYKKDKTFMIIVEPGDLKYNPGQDVLQLLFPIVDEKCVLVDIPFAILWCGTNYRIDNYIKLKNISSEEERWLKLRREFYNSLTDNIWVATEDLVLVDKKGTYIGQPYPFPKAPCSMKNKDRIVLHISSKNDYKGTGRIEKAFSMLEGQIDSTILSEVSHEKALEHLNKSIIYVMTMTDWASGTGYTGIEAMANGCLVMSKTPDKLTKIHTPIVYVDDEKELVDKIKWFIDNPRQLNQVRLYQFKWAREWFSNEAFAHRIWRMLNGNT